ncbi:MAG: beta-aspartyl-peptidase [Planctomycetes bacterium]|nr:beta-aspartyl-peptidase [Planctomycetota bacterium]
MKKILIVVGLFATFNISSDTTIENPILDENQSYPVIVIHGGAGWSKGKNKQEQDAIKMGLKEALDRGFHVLESGGSSLDAVEIAISALEDNPLFNAGRGSVYTKDEKQEMDASIMNGKDQDAGAVASVSRVKNPIKLARYIMEHTKHVLMAGQGAEKIAKQGKLELVDPSYFYSEEKLKRVRKQKAKEIGTVGALAMDKFGNIAAGTSTGGMTNKLPGRIGDSPIIGAGTWAQNNVCGVSGTGHGEYFIRYNVAREICARMEYLGLSVGESTSQVIGQLTTMGVNGGVIVLDKNGKISMEFNTDGMARAYRNSKGEEMVAIYK